MDVGYIIGLSFLVTLLIIATVSIARGGKDKEKDSLRRSLVRLFVVAIVTSCANITAVSAHNAVVSNIGYSMYFASMDWLVLMLLSYATHYTKIWEKEYAAPILIGVIAITDTISMMLNVVYNHCFDLSPREYDGKMYFDYVPHELWGMHLVFSYIIVAMFIFVFARKIVTTSGYHKTKYVIVLVLILMIVVANALFIVFSLPVDISLYLYIIAALGVAYLSLYYSPKNFIEYMLVHVTDSVGCAIACFDDNDECIYYNDFATQIFGKDNTKKSIEARFARLIGNKSASEHRDGTWTDEYVVDDVMHYFDCNFTRIFDKKDQYSGSYISMRDITGQVKAIEEEKYRISHDSLTGALNRKAFYKEARIIFETYPRTEFAVICSNVKDFKLVNDAFGIDVGDRILIKIADLIRSNLEESACFARMEADRFALLIPRDRFTEELFIQCMDEISSIVDNSMYRMHIQTGVYFVEDRTMPIAAMCDRAYLAINSIKNDYKKRIAYYGDNLRYDYVNGQKIISEFEPAMESEQIQMYLQPIVDVATKEVHLSEALVRWIHPDRGLCPPSEFIPILENTGDIYKLDMYMWEQACKQIAKWKASGINDMTISVNISVKDFYYVNVFEILKGLIEKYDISPERINLEITESAFMTDPKKLVERIKTMREYGFKIEIDDFGSGYSSLNLLKDMPADILKIDMKFMEETPDESKSQKIVNMVISLAKALDMKVITEGVELEKQAAYLEEYGCDMIQGYYFAKPMPVADFEKKYL